MRTSGKVLKDFEKLRKSLFDEEISHFAFMRNGKIEILYTQKYVDKLEKQLQQKENIIKEAREYIKEDRFYMSNGNVLSIANTGCGQKILEILDKENK